MVTLRIRTVKPEFWTDEKLLDCSLQARLTFIGLMNESDDQGRQLYSPERVKGALYPFEALAPKKVDSWVRELAREGVVHFYEDRGRTLLCIPNLRKHQVISKPSRSRLPACLHHGELHADPGATPGDSQDTPETPQKSPVTEVGSRNLEREKEREVGSRKELAPDKPARPRDPLFDAACEATGQNPDEVSRTGGKSIGVAVADLRKLGATPDEVFRRAANYPTHFSDAALTVPALAKHWATCGSPGIAGTARLGALDRLALELREVDDAEDPSDEASNATRRSLSR